MTNNKHRKAGSETATPEQYENSSIIRFGRLKNYIQEKLLIDYFAIQGNLKMAEGLDQYVQDNLEKLKKKTKIKVLDVGPAIGALTTLLIMQVLSKYDLLEKVQIYLVDISANVIDMTQRCDFAFPDGIIESNLKSKMLKKLRESKSYIGTAETMPYKDNEFTISAACFLFHHLHDDVKGPVAEEFVRVTEKGGFIGVAEEWFENYENDYAEKHQDDEIALAYESIISYKKMAKLLPNTTVFYKYGTSHKENSYAFCATKN